MASRFTIVGLGEAVFDLFPDSRRLGGAPLNVAVHAQQLGAPAGGRAVMVTRVGQDELGAEVQRELRDRGVVTDYVQTDPDWRTGEVYVHFDEAAGASGGPGSHRFEIARDVAWDWLQYDPDLDDLARKCDGVCFGTLAQRNGQSRSTIQRFLTAAPRAVRLFDVNLRENFYDRFVLAKSCEFSSVVKLNREELDTVTRTLGLGVPAGTGDSEIDGQARALLKRFNLRLVVVTMGERGAVVYTPEGRHEAVGNLPQYPAAPGADTVGCGDAYAAGLLLGLVRRWPLKRAIDLAGHMGAYLASQPGATPPLPESILKMAEG